MARIRYVILDFDGTCTQVDQIQEAFLENYRAGLGVDAGEWTKATAAVRAAAPKAGWTLRDAPSTAPACADPFILAGEALGFLIRKDPKRYTAPDVTYFKKIYNSCVGPFRPELADVIEKLQKANVNVAFISNSAADDITGRLRDLLGARPKVFAKLHVIGGANKMLVKEPLFDSKIDKAARAKFEQLDAARTVDGLGRPVYLRRGAYFEAMVAAYAAFPEKKPTSLDDKLAATLVCGDIWELDLAMPAALGARVHLIERAQPFPLYDYERSQMLPMGKGAISANLNGLAKRLS